ncbi:MAG TPA: calcium-translocating P-type ATPase, SERCA-type [Candidatus Saccharicenans sp.]|mgnify:FL=1|jgi:Ca2+-transporting ATPase|nr:calcium-translocating P-type ATPase, SERCA-type [Candidatus Saccharicenans sp.]HRD01075.1 calcium-translocating P-type ATPase, SERCA-type [Candidatus Saccharicenans sp.]
MLEQEPDKKFWKYSAEEIASHFGTDLKKGLTSEQASLKFEKYGPNELEAPPGRSPLSVFFDQFKSFLIWVLLFAAVISGFLGEWVDALAIVAIVILNAVLGFIQEYQAEKALLALKKMSAPMCRVIRDGQLVQIPARQVVPGDILELEAGDNISADARIISHTPNFSVLEASLTGESTPVYKTGGKLEEEDIPLADRANMVYAGTSVSAGKAIAIVVQVGMSTELGKIARMIQEISLETTPLQKKLEQFGRLLVFLCFGLVAVVFLLEWLRGGRLVDVFLTAVSLAVAAIPEGLPAVVTIALALGVQRLVKRHVLIRKLPSVETLGAATVICSDKTGTLTRNEMMVRAVYANGQLFTVSGNGYEPQGKFYLDNNQVNPVDYPEVMKTLTCCLLCNSASLVEENGRYKIAGDPTEGALLSAGLKAGLEKNKLEEELPLVEEIPFDSERKMMTMIRRLGEQYIAYVKGAPDILLRYCTKLLVNGQEVPLGEQELKEILEVNDSLAKQALRVLGCAYRILPSLPEKMDESSIEKDLTFAGLVAMIDPPRSEAIEAINKCLQAGIKPVMITGDHKTTAMAIASEMGMLQPGAEALSGEELDSLSQEELEKRVEKIQVYARVSPEHKLRIVRAWKKKGEVVAMTGDGVNDAPAVKEADIGVAMGITGTDVTKEVSDMVITDDNFASIVAAVEEGRAIYDNIKKFVHYLLSCNLGEIMVMFVASLVGWPVPLLPIQILWVNLVTDSLPALGLGFDPPDKDIMVRVPKKPDEPIIDRKRGGLMALQGLFIAFCSLIAFAYVLFVEKEGVDMARTAAFIVLAVAQLFHALNSRHQMKSIFELGVFTNMKLIYALLISLFLQLSVVYVPFMQKIFKTENLAAFDWVLVLILSSLPFWTMELVKWLNKKYKIYEIY